MRIPAVDFYVFWSLGQAAREGLVDDIYAPPARRDLAQLFSRRAEESGSEGQQAAASFRNRELGATSTPFLYATFGVLQTGKYDRDVNRYRAISVGLSLFAIALLCRLLRVDPLHAAAALAFATWAWVPLGEDLADGNVNQIQLAFLAVFLALQRHAPAVVPSLLAGMVLGIANAFKPNLVFVFVALALGWLVDLAWRRLLLCSAGAVLGAGLAFGLSTLVSGTPRPWLDWLALILSIGQHFDIAGAQENVGGARLLQELLGWNPAWLLHLAGWGLLVAALLPRRARERGPDAAFRREYLSTAAGALLPIVTMSLAWPHYLMLAAPAALYVLVAPTPARADPRFVMPAMVAVLGILASFPYMWWSLGGPVLWAATRTVSATLFFGVAVAEIRRTG